MIYITTYRQRRNVMGWTKKSLNRNYLTKMLNKQVEMKEDAIRRQREENLSKYLDSNKEKPSVNKKVLYGGTAWNKKHR